MSFSALILAGGRSSRMGRDKAWLEIDGLPLIKRQLALVRAAGAEEIFISGRTAPDYAALGCRVLEDAFHDAGPLAGIERGLAAAASPQLLVVAVDLPRMELGFLQRLLAVCAGNCGAVAEVQGRLEPLVAVYPKSAYAWAVLHLEGGRNAVHEFAEACEAAGELRRVPVASAEEPLFLNWNFPGDLPARELRAGRRPPVSMNLPVPPTFDPQTLCGVAATRPAHRIARWLLPVGAVAALLPWTPPWAALLGGTAIALGLGNPCASLTGRLAKPLLQLAVIGLGAGVNLAIVARVGVQGVGYTLVGLCATFAVGAVLGRWLSVGPRLGALICAGTGICGGSAIAAVAPAIEAEPAETSASLATVFLLNGVALLVFPALGTLAGFDAHAFGLWCALAIHDTSSVTGAALTHGPEALATATTVKLARALWIVPVTLALGWWFARGRGARLSGAKRGVQPPWFIGGFVALSALFTFLPVAAPAAPWILRGARAALTLTLFFIGAGLDRSAVKAVGARPFVLGLLLWVVVCGGTLAAIKFGWVR